MGPSINLAERQVTRKKQGMRLRGSALPVPYHSIRWMLNQPWIYLLFLLSLGWTAAWYRFDQIDSHGVG